MKVFDLTIDEIEHQIDAGQGPDRRRSASTGRGRDRSFDVVEGDTVRAIFKNNLHETTGIHFHGQRPAPTRWTACRMSRRSRSCRASVHLRVHGASRPARTCTTRTTTRPTRSAAGCSGAFIVEPKDPAERYDQQVRRDPGHRLDQQRPARRLHDQRPRLPGHRADRREARRDDRDPLHERGHDDPPVAPPRDADAGRRARRLSARARPRSRATRWA